MALDLGCWYAIGLFIPAFLAAISYLQAKNSFCVSYAASGKFSASADYADTSSVTNDADTLKDKSTSRKMYVQAAVYGLLATAVIVILNCLTQ